jgi:hypothetical protein
MHNDPGDPAQPSPRLGGRTPERQAPHTPFRLLGLVASTILLVVLALLVVAIFVT